MSFEWQWLDEAQRILKLRLYSFDSETTDDLLAQLLPILEDPRPLLVLVDLGDLALGDLVRQTPPENTRLPGLRHHEQHSSLAIVTTVPETKMVLDITNRLIGRQDAIRVFRYEDEALAWLEERSRDV
jgi:hypothetical protein